MSYGGGGFMQGGSQGSPRSSTKQSNHTHRPVTIRQLNEARQAHTDAEFRIDDAEVEYVTFVAYITNMARGNTNCSCTVEDGTGSIDVRVWLETGDDDTGKLSGIDENVYIRVIGTLKTFANKKSINATVIKPITDHNEIQYHLLDVIRVHLNHTRGPPNLGNKGAANGQHQRNQPQQRNGADPYAQNGNAGAANGADYSELKPLGRKIMQYVDRVGVENLPQEGLSLENIARAIGSNRQAIDDEIDGLLGEGLLYTTSDAEHVLPTNM